MEKIIKLFKKKNNTGTVFRNTLYLTVSEFFLKVLGVLWVIYLAHSVSVFHYGVYNYVTATIAIFSFLPDFGVGLIVIREIAANPKKAPNFLANSFFLNGILGVFTFFVIIIFSLFSKVSPLILHLIIIASLTLLISTIRSVAIFYFDGKEKMQYSAFLNSLNTFLLICFASLGVYLKYGLYGVFYGMFFATILSLIISWKFLLDQVKPTFHFDVRVISYYLKQGIPLGLASFASLAYTRLDILVMSHYLGEKAVGVYSSATPFAFALIQLLNVPFVVAVFPALTRIQKENDKRFRSGILKSLGLIALWSVPSSLFISLTAPILIPFIFGSKYNAGIPALQILIFFVPFISLSALLYKILIILEKQIYYLIISIIGAFINLVLNITLIPRLGILGASYSAVFTQICLFSIYSIVVSYSLRKKNGRE